MYKEELFKILSDKAAGIGYTLEDSGKDWTLVHDEGIYPSVGFVMRHVCESSCTIGIDLCVITIDGARPSHILGLLLKDRLFE